MGISGLLPTLKPIQKQKHLSEFAGQTLAVDAYVWLHRGAFACATELATGKPTQKYVEFCIQRVRLLRHHGIKPFLVFDGGPLPAKLGTEKEREKRRTENLEMAKALEAKGKHSQAREFYVKCVDVTPQMAFQVIKALRVDSVDYVVAPYEADAQLAYLERIGIVDGIITEDSDLLVFGCKNVHFKLDPVSSTLISISRSDFGSAELASESLSLVGWSDSQFRWMAMLSGCDYLPSIPGIGLKTAWALLKKYKSVDKVVRSIKLEGKKDVPNGYLHEFLLVEKVFLHQRVYDPRTEKLVHLTDLPAASALDEQAEAFVGRNLAPELAKRIALGEACPVSHDEMKDINPSYKPSPRGPPLQRRHLNTPNEFKGEHKAPQVGIAKFFSPIAKAPVRNVSTPTTAKPTERILAGKSSGKRSLVDVAEEDMISKRKKRISEPTRPNFTPNSPQLATSRFFGRLPANSSKRDLSPEKENASPEPSIKSEPECIDPVAQGGGCISPFECALSRNVTPDLSSPIRSEQYCKKNATSRYKYTPQPAHKSITTPTQFIDTQNVMNHKHFVGSSRRERQRDRILVRGSSAPPELPDEEGQRNASNDGKLMGPDLSKIFGDDDVDISDDDTNTSASEIGCWDDEDEQAVRLSPTPSYSATPPSLGPEPSQDEELCRMIFEADSVDEDGDILVNKIAKGWRARYSLGAGAQSSSQSELRRPTVQYKDESPLRVRRGDSSRIRNPLKSRRSDPYPVSSKPRISKTAQRVDEVERLRDDAVPANQSHVIAATLTLNARERLNMFRYNACQ